MRTVQGKNGRMTQAQTSIAVCATGIIACVASASAWAQAPIAASSVSKEKPQEVAAVPIEKKAFVQEGQGGVGGIVSQGNVQSAAANVGGFYGFRSGDHGARFDVAFGLAALAVDGDGNPANGFSKVDADGKVLGTATLVDNLNTLGSAKGRYDRFLGEDMSLYGAALFVHDSGQNLLARLRGELGYRLFFIHQPKHMFSGEIGGVYTIDNAIYAAENADTNGDGRVFVWGDETSFESNGGVFGARIAVNYANALAENVAFTQSLELIPNLSFGPNVPAFGDVDAPFEEQRTGSGDGRLGFGEATTFQSVSQLNVTVVEKMALGLSLTFTVDRGAIARRNAYSIYDAVTAIQLTYKIF